MAAVFLVTLYEYSPLFYIALVSVCFLVTSALVLGWFGLGVPVILRNSEETESSTRVLKKQMRQVKNPFGLEIPNPAAASLTRGVTLTPDCLEDCVLTCYWGCNMQKLHEALQKHVYCFRIKTPQAFEDALYNEYLCKQQHFIKKNDKAEKYCQLPEDAQVVDFGPVPRARYPLVALLTLADEEDREIYDITMARVAVLALLALLLCQLPQPVTNGLDGALQPSKEELEQATPEPNDSGWGPVIIDIVKQLLLWAAAELLAVPMGICYRHIKKVLGRRAAAERAAEEARKRRAESARRRRLLRRSFKDEQELLRTMKAIERGMARLARITNNISRRVQVSWAGFWRSTDSGLCEEKLPARDALWAGQGEPHISASSQRSPDPAPLHCISSSALTASINAFPCRALALPGTSEDSKIWMKIGLDECP